MDRCRTEPSVSDEDFDVFLNHRGPDVKETFAAQLYEALKSSGYDTFLDKDSLLKGYRAQKSIDGAIEGAKIHIAVISKGYAESKYCLNELTAIIKSRKPVIPIFYGVEPKDLRYLKLGPFAAAFKNHKRKRSRKEVELWAEALSALASITGYQSADYNMDEEKLIRDVVDEVVKLVPVDMELEVEVHRVGLESPLEYCFAALELMSEDAVGMLGLFGVGGIGKTSLSKLIYNNFVREKKIQHVTFLSDVGSAALDLELWRKLQDQLLWDLLRVRSKQTDTSDYKFWFKKLLNKGAVLIIIDDMDDVSQFVHLIPRKDLLAPGSRVIVNSRDRHVLDGVAISSGAQYFSMNEGNNLVEKVWPDIRPTWSRNPFS